ncbi:PD40 domain-containing protein [bacterium]|nr:PD40 domain-containing protein [bacterium]
MNLKRQAALAAALLLLGVSTALCQEAGSLFEKALFYEESSGELLQAITLYDRIVKEFRHDREIAAKAQLHIGICYEKLGKTEAVKAYETVIDQFPGEAGVVSEARNRLAELKKEKPTGLVMTRLHQPGVTHFEGPSLSPDGKMLAGVVIDRGQNLTVMDLESGSITPLTHYDWEDDSRWAWIPIWSPDGTQLVYQDVPVNEKVAYELHIRDLQGKERTLITNHGGGIVACDWLPDGETILVARGDAGRGTSLGLVSARTGTFRELCPLRKTYSTAGDMPSQLISASADASPDGRWIVFADGSDESAGDIYLIPAEGGQRMTLIDHPADDTEPRWSPDGQYVIYISNRHGGKALWGIAVGRDGKPDGVPFMIKEGMENTHLSSWTNAGLLTTSIIVMLEINVVEIDPLTMELKTPPRTIEFSPHYLHTGPRWSPDGQYLSAVSYRNLDGDGSEVFLSIIPAGGGDVRQYTIEAPVDAFGGSGLWLPEGATQGYIIYDKDKNTCFGTLDMKTGVWESKMIPTAEGFSGFMSMTWSAGGKGFYFLPIGGNGNGQRLLWQEIETGNQRTVYRTEPGGSLGRNLRASNDLKKLAVSTIEGNILIIDTETGEARNIDSEGIPDLFTPSWAPDGTALVAKDSPGPASTAATELYCISLTDGSYKSMNIRSCLPPKARIITTPDWSPDGRYIVFDLRTWNVETSILRNVVAR